MKSVDAHAHVFRADSPLTADARYRPAADATLADYVAHLDQHQLAYGVLVQPSFLGYGNSQLLAAIATHPQRLRGVAVLPPETDAAALQALDRQGIVGVRLNLFGQATPKLDAPDWRLFLGRIEALGWHIELHCPPQVACQVLLQLQAFQAPVVLDHFGRVDPDLGVRDPDYRRLLQLLNPDRDWVKVSGFYRLGAGDRGCRHARESLTLLLAQGMQHQLVWGSDWPHTQFHQSMTYDAAVAFLQELLPETALRRQILADNACRLFGFDA